jgi:hypothetical protein
MAQQPTPPEKPRKINWLVPLGGMLAFLVACGLAGGRNGTLLIERSRYVALTGDTRANDLWVWLAPGQSVAKMNLRASRRRSKRANESTTRSPGASRFSMPQCSCPSAPMPPSARVRAA